VNSRHTYNKLLDSAGELFQDFGYAQVSIRAIVTRAKVPKGNFYNYFASKEALAALIVVQQFEALLATLPITSGKALAERLGRHFAAINSQATGRRVSPIRLLATLSAESPALPQSVREQIVAGLESWSNRIAQLITQAQAHTQIGVNEEAHQLADFLINAWQGAMIRAKCDPTSEPLRTFTRFATENLALKSHE
jgi:TetR/AcrR family transcriptional repressor of nem operon